MNKIISNLFFIVFFSAVFTSCDTSQSLKNNNQVHGDTITLKKGIPLYDPTNRFIVMLDSVLSDSRCPKGVTCVWEGNATVNIQFNNLQKEIQQDFNLDTHLSFNNDTTLNNYYFKLLELNPYPENEKTIRQQDYSIKIIVKEI